MKQSQNSSATPVNPRRMSYSSKNVEDHKTGIVTKTAVPPVQPEPVALMPMSQSQVRDNPSQLTQTGLPICSIHREDCLLHLFPWE
jgi:hypothetical protein